MTSSKDNNWYVRTVCAILFFVFSLLYLYHYQAGLIAYTQHVCSGGQTQYNRVIGTVLIMIILMLLQFGLGRLLRRLSLLYALSYVPSLILLVALTSIEVTDGTWGFGGVKYILPLSLVAYVALMYMVMKVCDMTKYMYKYGVSTLLISNMSCMIAFFLLTLQFGNHDKSLHERLRMEQCILRGDYEGALDVSENTASLTPSATMLTAYALANRGMLAERICSYDVASGSSCLTPDGSATSLPLYPESRFYRYIGFWPKQKMAASVYLDYLYRHHYKGRAFVDYLLVSLLLDKKLDKFASYIQKFYDVDKTLPLHYREALTLYVHMRFAPGVVYHNNVMEADFQDFQKLEQQYADKTERSNMVRDVYGNTYWFYYFYK